MSTISDLAAELNDRAGNHAIGGLQALRQELKGLAHPPTTKLFGPSTIFEKYAYHVGGRTELQFNVGFETLDDDEHTRYGVAFSLEPSQALPDPLEVLVPRVARFNEFFRQHPDEFGDLMMWHWIRDHRSPDYLAAPILSENVRVPNFIFLGAHQPSVDVDPEAILDTFDRLMPLYRYVQGNDGFPAISESGASFVFRPGCSLKLSATTASRATTELDVFLRHNDLQLALYRHLSTNYGADSVATEQGNGKGVRIDVVVRVNSNFRFYEIKTASSARGCIREALTQLLEYSFWPGAQEAERLTIVGEPPLDSDSTKFLETLRERFRLPIYYEQFDMRSGALVS